MQKLLRILTSFLVVIIVIALIFSCKNRYEKAVSGEYEVYEYKSRDTLSPMFSIGRSRLTLKGDNTFLFSIEDKVLKGKWSADDDGDRTLITFYMGSMSSNGVIGGDSLNIIEIWNPQDFGCPLIKSLVYKRISK